MNFTNFIHSLPDEEKKNYEKYSEIRGKQIYRIVYETLCKEKIPFTYSEMNSFIRCDKALKDLLYTYLAVIEEKLKVYLFSHYVLLEETPEFASNTEEKTKQKRKERKSKIKPSDIRKSEVKDGEITELYKQYDLLFSTLIQILKDNGDKIYIEDLEQISLLRNHVMHHYPLLFHTDSTSAITELKEQITALIHVLPENYVYGEGKTIGFMRGINNIIKQTKENSNHKFDSFLLEEYDERNKKQL